MNESTHTSEQPLDVIMCQATDNLIQQVKVGDIITDHNPLLCAVHHPKQHLQEKKILTRKPIDLPSSWEDIVQGLRVNDGSESASDFLIRYNVS